MPLTDTFNTSLDDQPSFALNLVDADSLFAGLPDAESSFSGASWSADNEEVIDLAPYTLPPQSAFQDVHVTADPSSSSSSEEAFNFQPSAELAEMEAVVAAAERDISTPIFGDASLHHHQQQQEQHHHHHHHHHDQMTSDIDSMNDGSAIIDITPVMMKQLGHDGSPVSATSSRLRKRTASKMSGGYDSQDDDDFGSSGKRRKSRRATNVARPSRTAAKLAAIKNKTTRVAQTKLKRKAASTLTKSELELAGTLDLSRDELLNMTSDALESYAQRLAAERPLTAEEQKRFKRQRRLIKNRESAQLSRLRKKAYVDELEKQIAELEEEKDRYKKRCETQEKEGDSMRAELSYLRELVAQHPGLAQMAQNAVPNARRARMVQ